MRAVRFVIVLVAIGAVVFFAAGFSRGHNGAGHPTDMRIKAIAMRFARQMGDRSPLEIAYVATRRLAANRAAGGDIVDSNSPVYLVAVRGRFIDYMASPPFGAALPHGSVLTLVLTRSGLRVTDLGVGSHWPKLAGLGQVHELRP